MQKSMILELAGNGSCYMDDISVMENEEYQKCLKEIQEMLEKFCEGMTAQEKHDVLWKFELAQGGMEAITADEYFKQGFKLGLILAAQNFLV